MKRITIFFLVLTLAAGMLLGVGAVEPLVSPHTTDPEPWVIAGDELDPAGVASNPGAVPFADSDPTEPTAPDTIPAIGADGSLGSYVNDGGRYPVQAMVSFIDDDCRVQSYDVLFRQVIEPLGIPYTLSLPLDRLGLEGYIDEFQLLEMVDSGVSISCHTLNESAMTDCDVWELDALLAQWQETAQLLGCGDVLSYCYCNGIWSDELMPAIKSHFRMGFTVEEGINQIPYESYYMKRVGLFSNKTQLLSPGLRDGTYLNANGTLMKATPGQRQTSAAIPVKEGEEYLLTCSAIWRGSCYAIYNKAGKVIAKYNVPDTAQGQLLIDHKVRIPAGADHMVVSHNTQNYGSSSLTVQKLPDSTTMYNAKRYVDQVAREGGWLVFMTHAWYQGFRPEELSELVDYIREAGIPIVDTNDAIRLTGNVIEVGTFRKPLEYAPDPYFVVGPDGKVYTNSLQIPDVPENYESVPLELTGERVLFNNRSAYVSDRGYLVSSPVDVTGCTAVLVSGWAYSYDPQNHKGYQIYVITDADGKVIQSYSAATAYADGGEALDHEYIELPRNAAYITVAGNLYHTRPALTKIRGDI